MKGHPHRSQKGYPHRNQNGYQEQDHYEDQIPHRDQNSYNPHRNQNGYSHNNQNGNFHRQSSYHKFNLWKWGRWAITAKTYPIIDFIDFSSINVGFF